MNKIGHTESIFTKIFRFARNDKLPVLKFLNMKVSYDRNFFLIY